MAFDFLSDRLTNILSKIRRQPRLTEQNMDEVLREIRMALLEADVNLQVIQDFLARIKEKALGISLIDKVAPSEMVIKIVFDEMVTLLGEKEVGLSLDDPLNVMFMVGLQGSGKTTSAAKIANYLKTKHNKKVLLVAGDLQRPAAIEQLKVLGQSIDVDVFSLGLDSDVIKTTKAAVEHAQQERFQVVIVDTAGRLAIDDELMDELKNLYQHIQPQELLLSVDAMSGQDIVNVANGFKAALPLTGLMATKFDSDARGGGVLSVASLTQVPIKFVGTGEKVEDLELFYPDRMANRILGMGDVVSLVEKAQEKIDEKEAMTGVQRLMAGTFTLNDMLSQIEQMNKLGSLKGIMKMLPNAKALADQIDDDQASKSMNTSKAIILSMTPYERENPQVLKASRKNRIAKGSGVTVAQVNALLSQFEKTKQQMQMMLQGASPMMASSGSNTRRNPRKRKKRRRR
ncbi:MAG: signal recognition particle protein [Erysipelothrix sp.]|jgi:signal recognition particle subunit SRP54|nr:signal recognition particle protein [Erysipelothrix sp.]